MAQVLYIIGNGFDLAHEIQSSYAHFKEWLINEGYNEHVQSLENNFCFKCENWSDYETALGEYNIEEIYEQIAGDLSIDYDHLMRSQAIFEDAPDIIMGPFWRDIKEKFYDWVNSIDISYTKRRFSLPADAKYLTFNYTLTLENVYNLTSDHIFHIHGRVASDNNIIVGHNKYRAPNPKYGGNQWEMEEGVRERIKGAMNDNYKDVHSIIAKHRDYFTSLSNIGMITVFGHSYNDIDMPYFQKIKDSVSKECKWILNWHSNNDKTNAEKMIEHLGIMPQNVEFIEI